MFGYRHDVSIVSRAVAEPERLRRAVRPLRPLS